jgi:hypothetical protein
VEAAYSYEYGGRRYHGSRVSPETGSSSSGRHRERYAILKAHREREEPFPAWVNPEDPAESLLFREMTPMSWVMLPFGLVFAGVGAAVMIFGACSGRAVRFRKSAEKEHPERPWRADRRWAEGFEFGSRQGARAAGAWALAVLLGLFVGMFVYLVVIEHAPLFARVIVGVFALAPLAMLAGAVYSTLRWLKYGSPRLVMAEMPAVPGRELRCAVLCRRHVRAESPYKLTLKCSRTTGSGKHSTTRTLHESTAEVTSDLGDRYGGTAVPVELSVPEGLPSTSSEADGRIDWRLEVSAATPGVDFKVGFDLPVFDVEDENLIEKRPPGGG